jgi:transcriptional regulator with XRE-family HTH domain
VPLPLLRQLIGMALRRARQRQGRTLREVAASAGVSVAYLSELERGRKEASSEILAAVCRALGWQISDLLDDVQAELARGREEVRPVLSHTTARPLPAAGRRPYEGRLCTVTPARPGAPARRSTGPGRTERRVAHLQRPDEPQRQSLADWLDQLAGRPGPADGRYPVVTASAGALSPRC